MKICTKCGETKSLESFNRRGARADGLHPQCKTCVKIYRDEYNKNHKDQNSIRSKQYRATHKDQRGYFHKQAGLDRRARFLVTQAAFRAKAKGLDFDLYDHVDELQRRINMRKCELTGIELDLSKPRLPNSPSLDRIIPGGPYILSNVRIVCWAINIALHNWGEEVFLPIVKSWLKNKELEAI